MSALRVRVGSRNAAKLEAVRLGLAPFVRHVQIEGVEVESGVPDQPLGLSEIVRGAHNRARRSFEAGPCELAVGLEDGLVEIPELESGWANLGCCAIYDGRDFGVGLTPGFEYPGDFAREATGTPRRPIGEIFGERFVDLEAGPPSPPEAREGWGNIGALTRGALTRAGYGAQAVTCAYVRRLHPGHYGAVYRPGRA